MAVITRLVLIRHGEAHCNVAGLAGGENTCTGLTALGRVQVRQLAARLCGEYEAAPVDVLYSAPRRRVLETAQILSAALCLPVHLEQRLNGPNHGEADGQPWDQITGTGSAGTHPPWLCCRTRACPRAHARLPATGDTIPSMAATREERTGEVPD